MDIKIIYLTNDTRRYAGMKNACLQLQDEMKISDLCMAVKLERSSEWNYVWERKLRGSSLVVARFFNNIFKSKFWEECSRFLDANHIPYVIDAVESASAGDGAGVEKSVAARLRGYTFYGGAENFRNFWLYASSLTDPSVPVSEEPKPQCWAGIYHPDMPDGYTTLPPSSGKQNRKAATPWPCSPTRCLTNPWECPAFARSLTISSR